MKRAEEKVNAETQRAQRRKAHRKMVLMSAFAEFVAGEIAETIVGGVFVKFAERGIVENLLDKFVDGEAIVENHHADVDEFGGVFADDADADEFFIGAGEDEFEQACCVPSDVAACVVGVECAANNVVNLLFLAGLFG